MYFTKVMTIPCHHVEKFQNIKILLCRTVLLKSIFIVTEKYILGSACLFEELETTLHEQQQQPSDNHTIMLNNIFIPSA